MDQILHETGEIRREKCGFSRVNSFTSCFICKSLFLLVSLGFLISASVFYVRKLIQIYIYSQ